MIGFLRYIPAPALIPLFLLIFGITDANKVAIAAFAAVLLVLFNSAYGVMNAKKTRVMAAQIMGVSRWHVFKDVMLMESLAQTFVGLRTGVSMSLVISGIATFVQCKRFGPFGAGLLIVQGTSFNFVGPLIGLPR